MSSSSPCTPGQGHNDRVSKHLRKPKKPQIPDSVELESLSVHMTQADVELVHFFSHSLDLLCIAGFDGYLKRLNPAWTTRLGWTLAELKTRQFLEFVHPDDHAATQAEIGKLAEGVETILFENRYRHQDGSYRWFRWNASPVSEHGLIYASARDVTEQKRLEREILEIADREKEHLGRELHDGLCQSLAGIAALSTALARKLESEVESAKSAAANEITILLGDAIRQARDLAHGLGPTDLISVDLNGALATLARNVSHQFGISCTFTCDYPFFRLSHHVEQHLFRIAQEALNNAILHGRAQNVDVNLSANATAGTLSIRDNGLGMQSNIQNKEGVGLRTMTYRAHLIGGSLEVEKLTHRGIAVTCIFPIRDATKTNEYEKRRGTED